MAYSRSYSLRENSFCLNSNACIEIEVLGIYSQLIVLLQLSAEGPTLV